MITVIINRQEKEIFARLESKVEIRSYVLQKLGQKHLKELHQALRRN